MDQCLKLAFLSDNYPYTGNAPLGAPGGIGTYTQLIAEELARLGHEVHVFAMASVRHHQEIEHHGVRITQCPAWSRRREMSWIQAAEFTLLHAADGRVLNQLSLSEGVRRAVNRRIFDVIETPEFAGLGALLRRGIHAKCLAVRLHGGVHQHSSLSDAMKQDWFFGAEQELAVRADVITAPTQAVLTQSASRWNLSLEKAKIVPNPAVHIPSGPSTPRQNTAICYGRLEWRKGVDLLTEAACLVQHTKANFQTTFLGPDVTWDDGREGSNVIYSIANAHQRDSAVRILPARTGRSLGNELCASALAVFPSRAEAFGIAAVEAMLSGIPCILSDIPAFQEISAGGRYARLFQGGSSTELAKAIIEDLDHPSERNQRADAARRYAMRYLPHEIAPLLLKAWNT